MSRRISDKIFLPLQWLWLSCLLCLSPLINAEHNSAAPKKELILATSEGPPYTIREPLGGLDIDTVKAALENQGYQIRVIFVSLHRALTEVITGRADLTVPSFITEQPGLYNGDPHIQYHPTVFSLADKNISLKKVADMANHKIATFQGATGYFGPVFEQVSVKAPEYYEHHNMSRLVDMLMNDRTDLVLLDYWIFDYFFRQKSYNNQFVAHNDIFPMVPAVPVFNNQQIRDDYNKGLQAIFKNGRYQEIIDQFRDH